ncbi:MAG: hypothetical protein AB1405_01990 [Bdellovibrionota bacterium]
MPAVVVKPQTIHVRVTPGGVRAVRVGFQGEAGVSGSQVLTGAGAPASGLGVNGDFYVNTANGDYYKKSAGAWALQGSLRGPLHQWILTAATADSSGTLTINLTGADADKLFLVNSAANPVVFNLPSIAANPGIRFGWIDLGGSNLITLNRNGTDRIGNAAPTGGASYTVNGFGFSLVGHVTTPIIGFNAWLNDLSTEFGNALPWNSGRTYQQGHFASWNGMAIISKTNGNLGKDPGHVTDGPANWYYVLPRGGTTGQILKKNSATDFDVAWGSETGEANTASNVGANGAGVFKDKSGVDLRFRKLKAGAGMQITENADDVEFAATGGGGGAPQLLHVRHQMTWGTHAGGSTAGSWQTRPLNTVVTNEISGASLASNQMTLPAGTYRARWRCPIRHGTGSNATKTRLYNVTDSAVLGVGEGIHQTVNVNAYGNGFCEFTLAAQKTVELQYYCTTAKTTDGLGAGGTVDSSTVEVYATVLIEKVG